MRDEIEKNETNKKVVEMAREAEEKRLRAQYDTLEKARQQKEWFETHVAQFGKYFPLFGLKQVLMQS
jgi:hypothetical protein